MKNHIPSLDGLRTFSILCVLYAHVQLKNFHKLDVPGGQIGVTIFFVISGYLITYLLLEEDKTYGSVSLTNFYIRRTLRIFPAYYFLLFVYGFLQIIGVLNFTSASWFTSLSYTKYFPIPNSSDWETGHFWSLSAEELFYLIWPFAFKYLKNYRTQFAFLVILSAVGFRLFSNINAMNLLTRADAMMVGVLIALYHPKILSLLNHLHRVNPVLLITPFVVLVGCVVFKRILHLPDSGLILAFAGSYGILTNICIGFIILISITFRDNLWYQLLNWKYISRFGIFSYSIYLWQQLFFSVSLGFWSSFPLNLFLIAVAAIASYYFIEQPFLRLKSRFIKHRAVPLKTILSE